MSSLPSEDQIMKDVSQMVKTLIINRDEKTWRKKLFRTEDIRVFILPDRLVFVRRF
jgi:hypothetical protein